MQQKILKNKTTIVTTSVLALMLLASGVGAEHGDQTPIPHIFDGEVGSPCQDVHDTGEQGGGVLCPDPWATASCASAAVAVVADTQNSLGSTSSVTEGTSRAGASAYGPGAFSDSEGSGSLHQSDLLNGDLRAGTLESDCFAWSWSYGDRSDGCARGTADVQRLEIAPMGLRIKVLDSETYACSYGFVDQDSHITDCFIGGLQCSTGTAPNTFLTPVPGVTVVLNEQGSEPYAFGTKTLYWTAAVHVILTDQAACSFLGSCTGDGLHIYVSYTSVAV